MEILIFLTMVIINNAEWSRITEDYIKNNIPKLEGIYDSVDDIYEILEGGLYGNQVRCMLCVLNSTYFPSGKYQHDIISIYQQEDAFVELGGPTNYEVNEIDLEDELDEANNIPDYEDPFDFNIEPSPFKDTEYIKWTPFKPFSYDVWFINSNYTFYIDCIITDKYAYDFGDPSVKCEYIKERNNFLFHLSPFFSWNHCYKLSTESCFPNDEIL